jgi:cyclic beta-1,2-glucan synthetase
MSLNRTDGYVLDPVFVMRQRVSLEPRQQAQITVITVAAGSREELMRLIAKYRDADVCNRAFELAWSHAQIEYRYLGIQSDAAMRFAELASHLLYPNPRLRATAERLRRNVQTQSRLWAHGISGDWPLAVWATIRKVLRWCANCWLRILLAAARPQADLVILNREPASYEQPLHQQLLRLVEAHSLHTGVEKPGGVFLRQGRSVTR